MRDSTWPENGTVGRIDLAYLKTWQMRDFATFENHDRRAIPFGRKAEPTAVKILRLFGKRGRCAISLIADC